MLNNAIPLEWDSRVREELDSTESVLWFGQPSPGNSLIKAIPGTFGGITFVLGPAMMIRGILDSKYYDLDQWTSNFAPLAICGLAIFVGIYFSLSPLFAYFRSKKTAYVVTGKRAIIFEGDSTLTAKLTLIKDPGAVYRIQRMGGRADLIFSGLQGAENISMMFVFHCIDNAKEVESLIKESVLGG